ncbi:hypothetical protein L1987_57887 [Smallanthus sonchifolius]|uniref:Uncharacterized protein n=1 Tax=Smallanthus sonchifolius TaxID=185202 RepID=A0ACB9DDT7_9ASTR|nr:hypothetical protein L1987_57887 [Smallanthus sonchifolius]
MPQGLEPGPVLCVPDEQTTRPGVESDGFEFATVVLDDRQASRGGMRITQRLREFVSTYTRVGEGFNLINFIRIRQFDFQLTEMVAVTDYALIRPLWSELSLDTVQAYQQRSTQVATDRLISSIILVLAADSYVPRRQIVAADYPCQAVLAQIKQIHTCLITSGSVLNSLSDQVTQNLKTKMAQSNGFEDIGSINRPPRLVSGEDYDVWKNRMESFFCYQEYGMWKSIRDGPYTPMVASADFGGPTVPKDPSKYSEEDIKKMEVDFKALGAIQMCLPNEVFHNFRSYKTAKELWEALKKMFAGSEEIKENRRDILKQQYENFLWKEGESLTVLYNRYTYLVGELQCSKVKLENEDILKKFITSLPSCGTLYTVSIRRTENLKTLQMTELFGMLKTYELEMIQAKQNELKLPNNLHIQHHLICFSL